MKEEVDLEEMKLSEAIQLNVACLFVAPRGASERDEKTESRSGSAGAGAGSRVSKRVHERALGSARDDFCFWNGRENLQQGRLGMPITPSERGGKKQSLREVCVECVYYYST